MCMYVYIYIYIYKYICVCVCVYAYIYIYIDRYRLIAIPNWQSSLPGSQTVRRPRASYKEVDVNLSIYLSIYLILSFPFPSFPFFSFPFLSYPILSYLSIYLSIYVYVVRLRDVWRACARALRVRARALRVRARVRVHTRPRPRARVRIRVRVRVRVQCIEQLNSNKSYYVRNDVLYRNTKQTNRVRVRVRVCVCVCFWLGESSQ